ncbi:MAG: hypothetical protein WBQ55_01945 [Xanthobacteraceae bacterium]
MAKHPAIVPIVAATIRLSEASCSTICRKLFTIHECVTQSHNWSIYEKDKASVLLREIMRRCEWHGVSRLLQGASRDMYKAVFGPWCGIEGHNGAAVPELRWCDLPARIVCYRAGLSAPLATKQFEAYREQLEELWGGPVLIEIGAAIGAAPGCVVVRPTPVMVHGFHWSFRARKEAGNDFATHHPGHRHLLPRGRAP